MEHMVPVGVYCYGYRMLKRKKKKNQSVWNSPPHGSEHLDIGIEGSASLFSLLTIRVKEMAQSSTIERHVDHLGSFSGEGRVGVEVVLSTRDKTVFQGNSELIHIHSMSFLHL